MNELRCETSERLFVVTGGPGAGKTTLIDGLERAGHARSEEAGRAIIKDQVSIGGRALPWCDPALYAELQLCWEMRSHRLAGPQPGIVFFDRGMPDIVGYLRLVGLPVPPHVDKAAWLFRYNRRVFIAPPWPEIFTRDSERKQTQDEAERTYDAMVVSYSDYGYDLLEIPRGSVSERVRFVQEHARAALPAPRATL